MMETARIRKAGYPIRHTYKEFVERYRPLMPSIGPSNKIDCAKITKEICKKLLDPKSDHQFGKTKIFLKDHDDIKLEAARSAIILKSITTIQQTYRRIRLQRYIKRCRQAAITIQKCWRQYRARKQFLIMSKGFHRLAACVASHHLSKNFKFMRMRVLYLQAHCKGMLVRRKFQQKHGAHLEKLRELRKLRKQEEEKLKNNADPNWKKKAEINYRIRLNEYLNPGQAKAKTNAEIQPAAKTNGTVANGKANGYVSNENAKPKAAPIKANGYSNGYISNNAKGFSYINGAILPTKPNNRASYLDFESTKQVVDDAFDFLNDADLGSPQTPDVAKTIDAQPSMNAQRSSVIYTSIAATKPAAPTAAQVTRAPSAATAKTASTPITATSKTAAVKPMAPTVPIKTKTKAPAPAPPQTQTQLQPQPQPQQQIPAQRSSEPAPKVQMQSMQDTPARISVPNGVRQKSALLEIQLRYQKNINTKLLSQPVRYYEGDQTRL